MKIIEFKVAQLHQHQIETYLRLHQQIPLENKIDMLEQGYEKLEIFRIQTLLIMRIERDSRKSKPISAASSAATLAWQHLTEPLFAQPWMDAPKIFSFDATQFELELT
jgi:hypothetical protein